MRRPSICRVETTPHETGPRPHVAPSKFTPDCSDAVAGRRFETTPRRRHARALGDLRNSRYPPSSTPSRRRRNVRRFELSLLYLSTRDARETPTARRPTLVHSANLLRPAPIDADCPDMTHPRHILPAIVALIGGN